MSDHPSLFGPSGRCTCGDIYQLETVHRADAPCFRWEPPSSNHLGGFQAHSGTSRSAALDNYPRSGSQRARVLNTLWRFGRQVGCTDDELFTILDELPVNAIRPRRVELVRGGWVEARVDEDGEPIRRGTRAGSLAQVWIPSRQTWAYMRGDL